MDIKTSRKRLARIRCVKECVEIFKNVMPLPEALCFVPVEVQYKSTRGCKLACYNAPDKQSDRVLQDVSLFTDSTVVVSGEELCNAHGQWARLKKYDSMVAGKRTMVPVDPEVWLLLQPAQASPDLPANTFLPATSANEYSCLNSWEYAVENKYALKVGSKPFVLNNDKEATARLQQVPPMWSLEHDEDLASFLASNMDISSDNLGSVKNYIESIEVSSFCEDDGPDNMTDGDPETYWESDGNQGQHWIRLTMKKGTIIKKLLVTIDSNDDNYVPYKICVVGGERDDLKKLNDTYVDINSLFGMTDLCILEDQKEHYAVIEIRIKECKGGPTEDGIDTRIHNIKIQSSKEQDLGLSKELFSIDKLVRFPKLENIDSELLYRRAIVLQRFVSLLDSVLPYIVPSWEYSVGSYNSLEAVRQILPLSKRRLTLIDTFLRESESGRPSGLAKLYINRQAAAEHKSDPTQDPTCKNTVFSQIYEGLKPRDRQERPLDYRWPSRYDQWWECKFLSEGIIDQGGGFRDSLSDLSDELCPSDSTLPVPLPFFIHSPNQKNEDSNVNRDMYIANPSCKEFHKYEWIGQLMGACLRGKENLVLSLPSFFWKKLAGEHVKWARDFYTVDAASVKLMENMQTMDEESFVAYFGEERSWTTVLSDGSTVPLESPSGEELVAYEDRNIYAQLVQQTRVTEADEQIAAIKRGLLQVVPQAVLDLLTWQELERRICGDPEVTVEALKSTAHYEELDEGECRVRHLWEALTNFSNEDRSRFLRFVTGRRRLPTPLYICLDKGESVDALPESSTCSNTLYLPEYSSPKICEEKLRYAAYNCIAIDTDMSPWDE